jgi:hypothetical protein
VLLTHWMAMESDKIKATAIEANDFPELSRRYHVMAVPRTVINDQAVLEGALPEPVFIRQILGAISPKA